MTNDRYTLKRKIEKGKGNKQSGLELEIIDAYTGKERHVSTLSGGEGFKASLALALGLADVDMPSNLKYCFPWVFGMSLLVSVIAGVIGVIPF